MDEQYGYQVAELMQWTPVHVRVPPTAGSSANTSSSNTSATPPSTRHNNPGYLFYTFPTAADAASVLAQLHTINAAQSRVGQGPVRLPNSEHFMDLGYASSVDALECWKLYNGQ